MKSTISLFLISTFLFMGCIDPNKYQYIIKSNEDSYFTESYETTDDGCVKFKYDSCGCNSNKAQVIIICGTYTIIKKQ